MTNPSMENLDNDDDRILDELLGSIVNEITEWKKKNQKDITENEQQSIIQKKCQESEYDLTEDQLYELDSWVTRCVEIRRRC